MRYTRKDILLKVICDRLHRFAFGGWCLRKGSNKESRIDLSDDGPFLDILVIVAYTVNGSIASSPESIIINQREVGMIRQE